MVVNDSIAGKTECQRNLAKIDLFYSFNNDSDTMLK